VTDLVLGPLLRFVSDTYEVALDSRTVWPAPSSDLPPSVVRTLGGGAPLDICFGSCRVAVPHEPPYTESKDSNEEGREIDALALQPSFERRLT